MVKKLLLVIVLFLLSCNGKDHTFNDHIINLDVTKVDKEIVASVFIDSIYSFRLELPDSLVWGRPRKILFAQDHIYILDKMQHKIYHFSRNGDFINVIDKKGNGPGEYVSIDCFFLDDQNIYVNDVLGRRINKYTFDGDFIDAITYHKNMIFHEAMAVNDSLFLCFEPASLNGWIINKHGEILRNLFDEKQVYPYMYSEWEHLYTQGNDAVGLHYPPTGEYYSLNLNDMTLEKTFIQRVNQKMLSAYAGVKSTIGIDHDFTYSPFTFVAENWIFSLWSLPENRVAISLYSKASQESVVFKRIKMDLLGYNDIGFPVSTNLSDRIVSIITDEFPEDKLPDNEQEKGLNEGDVIIQVMKFK